MYHSKGCCVWSGKWRLEVNFCSFFLDKALTAERTLLAFHFTFASLLISDVFPFSLYLKALPLALSVCVPCLLLQPGQNCLCLQFEVCLPVLGIWWRLQWLPQRAVLVHPELGEPDMSVYKWGKKKNQSCIFFCPRPAEEIAFVMSYQIPSWSLITLFLLLTIYV